MTTTEDAILGERVRLLQPERGYRVAIDPVFLAAAVPAKPGDRVLDAGCGVGVATLCLAARVAGIQAMGLEIQPEIADLARRNAELNGAALAVETGSIAAPPSKLEPNSFHHVMANPPYLEPGRANASPDPSKAASTVEGGERLRDWIDFCIRMARPKGSVTLIQRADRLDAILSAMHGRLGEIVVFPLWPGSGRKGAGRVVVRGRKGLATPLALSPGLVLHDADGRFTKEAEGVLRHANALDIAEMRD